jgi:hypothetical protein
MDYNGNPIGGGMGAQTNMGGPQMRGGPAYGGSPLPGDLFNRAVNQFGKQVGIQPGGPGMIGQVLGGMGRFQPGGMIPPAGARPQPGEMTGPYTRQRYPAGDPRRYGNPRQVNPGQPGLQPGPAPMPGPTPMPMPMPGRGKGGGGGKGGMPGPGGQFPGGINPVFTPGGPGIGRPVFGPAPIEDIGGDGGGDGGGGWGNGHGGYMTGDSGG